MSPVNKAPSVPNLTLLAKALAGSLSPSTVSCNSVGPPRKFPKVPAASTSPMKTPSIAPPVMAPAANFVALPAVFSFASFVTLSTNTLLFALSTS